MHIKYLKFVQIYKNLKIIFTNGEQIYKFSLPIFKYYDKYIIITYATKFLLGRFVEVQTIQNLFHFSSLNHGSIPDLVSLSCGNNK